MGSECRSPSVGFRVRESECGSPSVGVQVWDSCKSRIV